MESRHLHVKATADNVLTCRRNLIRRAGNVRSLGTTLSANQFRVRATQYAYRWPGAAPASTPCPREGAGPCPPIPCGGGASPNENGGCNVGYEIGWRPCRRTCASFRHGRPSQ